MELEELPFQVGKGVLGSLPIINRKGFVIVVLVLAFGLFGLLLLSYSLSKCTWVDMKLTGWE